MGQLPCPYNVVGFFCYHRDPGGFGARVELDAMGMGDALRCRAVDESNRERVAAKHCRLSLGEQLPRPCGSARVEWLSVAPENKDVGHGFGLLHRRLRG